MKISAETSDPIAEGRHTWTEGVKTADAARVVSTFCDDIILMPPNETTLYGRGEALEWLQEYFQHFKITVLSGTERELQMMGDTAIEQWSYMVAIDPVGGGERIRDDGRSLTIWKREPDGVWRIAQTMWNSIRPIGAGTSRFLVRLKQK
jgi:ketosteroid isomerase-like protein